VTLAPDERAQPEVGPIHLAHSQVYVGTCSWADPSMVKSEFYPRGAKTNPEARLRHYASVFPTVEIDATFHALQTPDRAEKWLTWTPPSFRFNVKAFAWLTRHESDPRRLPAEIAALLPPDVRGGHVVRGDNVPEEALTAAWDYFGAFVDEFKRAGRLGYVLFQLPKGQGFSAEVLAYLDGWAPYLRSWPVAVEIRHADWLYRKNRETFLGFLREHGLAYVIPDIVQAQYLPPPDPEVTADWSVIRFHGRSPAMLERRAPTERVYDYRYSPAELGQWAETVRGIAQQVGTLYLMFNNHARGQGAQNGREMMDLLSPERANAFNRDA